MSLADLRRQCLDHRGSDRGDQIAVEIVNKTRSEPLPAEQVGVTREVLAARTPEIKQMLEDALYEGNSDKISELSYELQRGNKQRSEEARSSKNRRSYRQQSGHT